VQTVTNRLSNAYGLAEFLLENNQVCANLFGQGKTANGTTMTAAQVLGSLYDGGPLGSITVGDLPSRPGTIVSASTQPGIVYSGATRQNAAYITINDLAGSFLAPSAEGQAVTLLHELGHAMNDIFGAGTSLIQQDGQSVRNGTQISMDNTALVDNTCIRDFTPPGVVLLP
jgi:hypothetical protein